MKKMLLPVFNFFLKPEQESFSGQNVKNKIKWLLFLLVFELPFMFVILSLYYLLVANGLVNSENHLVVEAIRNNSKTFLIVFLIFVGPFIEELIFRLPLRFQKANFIPLTVAILFFFGTFLFKKLHHPLAISIFALVSTISVFYIFNRIMAEKREKFISFHYPVYFYVVTILFALIHLSNFSYSVSILLFAPIIVLPQFIGGFLFGFIRLKQGFIWGFLLHALHNMVFLLPIIFLPTIIKPKLIEKIDRKDYTFEVYEGYHFDSPEFTKSNPTTSVSKVTPDEIVLYGNFKNVVSIITHTNKKYIRFKNSLLPEKEISLYFKNDSLIKLESSTDASRLSFENLLKAFDLKSKKEKGEITVWNLTICNTEIFQKYVSGDGKVNPENPIRTFYGKIDTLKLQNINSEILAQTLRIAFDTEVKNGIDKKTVFSIEIPNNDFNELKKFLENNYGLTIEEITDTKDFLVIY